MTSRFKKSTSSGLSGGQSFFLSVLDMLSAKNSLKTLEIISQKSIQLKLGVSQQLNFTYVPMNKLYHCTRSLRNDSKMKILAAITSFITEMDLLVKIALTYAQFEDKESLKIRSIKEKILNVLYMYQFQDPFSEIQDKVNIEMHK